MTALYPSRRPFRKPDTGRNFPFCTAPPKQQGRVHPALSRSVSWAVFSPLASPSVLMFSTATSKVKMLTTTVALASTTAMAFDGRWTGVREHTQFVGECAEQTRQSWSKISSFASLSVRQLLQTCARTYETTQTNTSSRTVRQCVPEFSASFTKMCGWLVVFFDVSSRFQMMSKWHMGFTDQTTVETTLRKGILCASNSNQLQSNVSTSNSVTKILPVVVRTDSFQEERDRGRRSQVVEESDAGSFQYFWSVPLFLEIHLFPPSFHLRFKIAFLPCDFDTVHALG